MALYKTIDELVGKTPLFELTNIEEELGLEAKIYGKLEFLNPTGSTKDRAALGMILDAEKRGILDKDTAIIEPTSGNTGIGLAAIGSARGYRVIIVMPDSMSVERQKLMTAFGAELVLTPGALGIKGSIDKANEIAKSLNKAFIPDQFNNIANAKAHYETTGPEIYEDLNGEVDFFVAGIGSAGTISGIGKYLKDKNKNTKIIGVEPADSPLLTENRAGSHKIQGIGANFVPSIYDKDVVDTVLTVTTEEAYDMVRLIARKEGLLVGITSGAALAKAVQIAKKPENKGKNIVAHFPDTGARYLSTPDLF